MLDGARRPEKEGPGEDSLNCDEFLGAVVVEDAVGAGAVEKEEEGHSPPAVAGE